MLALAYFAVPLVGQQQASQQRVAGPRETQFNLELLAESEGVNSNCLSWITSMDNGRITTLGWPSNRRSYPTPPARGSLDVVS